MNSLDSPTVALALQLLSYPSITPDTTDCLEVIAKRLVPLGFECEWLVFSGVKNLWAVRGNASPMLCFLGHTDVVPTGDTALWRFDPFSPTIAEGKLYARGAADMKTAIACFVVAVERFLAKNPAHKGAIALLLTADEEGAAVDGTKQVVKTLMARGQNMEYCLVGEPSSTNRLGDVIKNGRRGSLSGRLCVTGRQGHIAYPHLAVNPILVALPALDEFAHTVWDEGNDYFDPTSLQLSNINAGTGANNVIPQTLTADFNFRFSTQSTAKSLQARTHEIFDRHFKDHEASYHIDWRLSGEPFLTQQGKLVAACQEAVQEVLGIKPVLSTSGGTSDGRFVAQMGGQVVELGVLNATIHQIDECVSVLDLDKLTDVYEKLLQKLLL